MAQWQSFSIKVAVTHHLPSELSCNSQGDGIWEMRATFQSELHCVMAGRPDPVIRFKVAAWTPLKTPRVISLLPVDCPAPC
jgi:hypothetical protein